MEHPKDVGDRSTLAIMTALRELGYAMYVPFGENTRVDLVIEKDARLLRVQCKTGRLRSGTVRFDTCSSYAHHPAPKITRRTYAGQIDLFAVYCPQNGGVYLVPLEHVPQERQAMLRVEPTRNNQRKRVRFAADYEIGRVQLERR